MGLTSRRIHRILHFSARPLLAVVAFLLVLQYLTSSPSPHPPKPKDTHPHLSKHLIVASTLSSNLTWLYPSLRATHWTPHIYVTDDPHALTVPKNKGNEAMVYLTYIIDNYDTLPDVMFFHHDHHQAWHQMFSSSYELAHLNLETVLKQGYVSPRCLPGCENVIELPGNVAPMSDLRTASRDVLISTVLKEFLRNSEGRKEGVPEKIAAPCCAQFAVSREAVRRRSLMTWVDLREWLLETNVDSGKAGRVLEWTWHLWFGMEPV
jgi:Protein of unknown function (DUF3431)